MGGSSIYDSAGLTVAVDPVNVYLLPGTYTIATNGLLHGRVRLPGVGSGSYTFAYWGDPIAPGACSGTSVIVSSINSSKLFMTLANGVRLAYSNAYGSTGGTVYTYAAGITYGTFPVGKSVTYTGVLDASLICVPDSISIF
jgi:hypothetical protein